MKTPMQIAEAVREAVLLEVDRYNESDEIFKDNVLFAIRSLDLSTALHGADEPKTQDLMT